MLDKFSLVIPPLAQRRLGEVEILSLEFAKNRNDDSQIILDLPQIDQNQMGKNYFIKANIDW